LARPLQWRRQAVDELGATRIGHGCSAAQDPELMRRLARDRILVECCISSNYHTGAVRPGARHPIHEFLEAGVPVAVCSDNTTVSRTDQVRESLQAAEQIGLDAVEHVARLAEPSLRGLHRRRG
jgi:adenosine deaminase